MYKTSWFHISIAMVETGIDKRVCLFICSDYLVFYLRDFMSHAIQDNYLPFFATSIMFAPKIEQCRLVWFVSQFTRLCSQCCFPINIICTGFMILHPSLIVLSLELSTLAFKGKKTHKKNEHMVYNCYNPAQLPLVFPLTNTNVTGQHSTPPKQIHRQ